MLRECLWIAAHYRDTEAVLTRQFRLLAVLLYLGGYFPKGNAGGMLPEKCFILLNAPELSSLLTDDTALMFWRRPAAPSSTADRYLR